MIQIKKDAHFFLDEDFSLKDVNEDIVGRKGLSLFTLKEMDVPVPTFFVISSSIFSQYIADNLIKDIPLDASLKDLHEKIMKGDFDAEIKNDILTSYSRLSGFTDAWVAVRSSVVPPFNKRELTFAGLLETRLNVKGLDEVVEAIKVVYASMFTEKVANYLASAGTSIASTKVAVVVQKMVQAEASGILFTVDPVSQNKELIMTEAVFGLGDVIAAGEITPDQYVIDKKTLEFKEKRIVPQEWMMVRKARRNKGESAIQKVQISRAWQHQQKIDDRYLKELTEVCIRIEKKLNAPQDIEWVLEGSRLWILQNRDIQPNKLAFAEYDSPEVSQDIIEAAQKIAEKERSRQSIREKIYEQRNPDSEEKKKETANSQETSQKETVKKETADTTKSSLLNTATDIGTGLGTGSTLSASVDNIEKNNFLPPTPTEDISTNADLIASSQNDSNYDINEPSKSQSINKEDNKDDKIQIDQKPADFSQLTNFGVQEVPAPVRDANTRPSPQKGEKLLLTGIGASAGLARGYIIVIRDENDFEKRYAEIFSNSIIVIPDYISGIENVLDSVTGIICDTGGITSDIAIIAREIGIPCIMGCGIANRMLIEGEEVLIDGNVGAIYGKREFSANKSSIQDSINQITPSLNKSNDIEEEKIENQRDSATINEMSTEEIITEKEVATTPKADVEDTLDTTENTESSEPTKPIKPNIPLRTETVPLPTILNTEPKPKDTPTFFTGSKKIEMTEESIPETKTATDIFVNLSNSFARGEKWQDHMQKADGVCVIQLEDIYRRLDKHPDIYLEKSQENDLIDEISSELSKICELANGNLVIASIGSMSVSQYKNLKHGEKYEKWTDDDTVTDSTSGLDRLLKKPKELNAMIKAIRRVRNVEGWRNISIAIEYAATVENLIELKKMLTAGGLRRSSTFALYIVVDTPSVAMSIESFANADIDGAIIDMVNLAKLMRAPEAEDESVLKVIENIRSSWKDGSLIVQAPPKPQIVIKRAVKSGIRAIACSPADIDNVRLEVAQTEREMVFAR